MNAYANATQAGQYAASNMLSGMDYHYRVRAFELAAGTVSGEDLEGLLQAADRIYLWLKGEASAQKPD